MNTTPIGTETIDLLSRITERQQIIEKIGEVSGRDIKIRQLGERIIEQSIEEAEESWNKWQEGLKNRLIQKSQKWNSPHNPVFSQKDLVKDYIKCFNRDLGEEIDCWEHQEFASVILKRNIAALNTNIKLEIKAAKALSQNKEQQLQTNLYEQVKLSFIRINDDVVSKGWFLTDPEICALPDFFTLLKLDLYGLGKNKIVELGFQNFETSKEKIYKKLTEIVKSLINNKVQAASQVVEQVISSYENLLEQ
ncbi:hypothetical protein [Synechocystis sp. PCC 7509]|uniref:hypothetical protein n=1 Tax=Synechocystis sp. PCC 7509 TaxID=927677 RepID=UPI0002ABBC55|nr:hypothetical protein [Synechocystis sp. PCC 7509]